VKWREQALYFSLIFLCEVIFSPAIPAHCWFVLYERCQNASRWFI
jgi:hypothetical protein